MLCDIKPSNIWYPSRLIKDMANSMVEHPKWFLEEYSLYWAQAWVSLSFLIQWTIMIPLWIKLNMMTQMILIITASSRKWQLFRTTRFKDLNQKDPNQTSAPIVCIYVCVCIYMYPHNANKLPLNNRSKIEGHTIVWNH